MQDEQGGISVRFIRTGEEVPVDLRTLDDWIRSGTVAEDDLLRGQVLTNGEWMRAGDTRLFRVLRGEAPPPPPAPPSDRTDDREQPHDRYQALLFISGACRVLAVILFALTLVEVVVARAVFAQAEQFIPPGVGFRAAGFPGLAIIDSLVKGSIAAVLLWAVGEAILLFIDIEGDTRRAAAAGKKAAE